MTWEHLLSASLFTYAKAPKAQVTCKECNDKVSDCEYQYFQDPFIQQAKTFLLPVDHRKKRSGWVVNYAIAYHRRTPGYLFLVDPKGIPVSVLPSLSSEAVWRAMAKSMLVFAVFMLGDRVFASDLEPIRAYILEGGSHEAIGVRRGPNSRSERWQEYHELRIEFTDDGKFAVFS